MDIEFDPAKRDVTLRDRGLDFPGAPKLFAGRSLTVVDDRINYGKERSISHGVIDGVAIALVWTDRNGVMRIISMGRMHLEEINHVKLG